VILERFQSSSSSSYDHLEEVIPIYEEKHVLQIKRDIPKIKAGALKCNMAFIFLFFFFESRTNFLKD